jgi:hypothetical protein
MLTVAALVFEITGNDGRPPVCLIVGAEIVTVPDVAVIEMRVAVVGL